MASASKTPNLNLPQWVGTEKPERTDFNAAFDAIDTTVASHLAESALKHITESGSNANGRYIKFDDGTMICTYNATVTDQAITDAWGSMFIGLRTWTYPASFISAPSVNASIFRWGSGASFGSCWSNGAASATMRAYDIASRAAGTDTILGFMAIGRWK